MGNVLGAEELDHFTRTGWLLTRTLDDATVARLRTWADEVAGWADREPPLGLHHREQTDGGPRLCRSERLIDHHEGLRRLLTLGNLPAIAGDLLGEPAVLYKEKINHKLPGGAGYAPHQDAPAYPFVDRHVSAMVAIDDATVGNGTLEVVEGAHDRLLPLDERGCIAPGVLDDRAWVSVEVPAGATLWFHSRTPHRSGSNRSERPRRALYPTYNAAAQGDLRAGYYREKAAAFAAAGERTDGGARVSLIDDFEGRAVR